MRLSRFIAVVVFTVFASAAVAAPRDVEPSLTKKIINKVRFLIQSLEGGYISPPRP